MIFNFQFKKRLSLFNVRLFDFSRLINEKLQTKYIFN
jgi:hypothetical protein